MFNLTDTQTNSLDYKKEYDDLQSFYKSELGKISGFTQSSTPNIPTKEEISLSNDEKSKIFKEFLEKDEVARNRQKEIERLLAEQEKEVILYVEKKNNPTLVENTDRLDKLEQTISTTNINVEKIFNMLQDLISKNDDGS